MNAPAAPELTVELLPLKSIEPSTTHIQELRRARFDKKALQELADSIKVMGVLQPIVVRPLGLADRYQLVAGERRWQAARIAGLERIPASIRSLTPEQVLEVQLIENLQRDGLHELEEAEGYDELMKLKKINAEAVADLVGKSRSYVYARTKLLALCPEARKAFYGSTMDSSTALVIARIPGADLQLRAIKDIEAWRRDGEVTNFRDVQRAIGEHYMVPLKKAPFDRTSAQLVPAAGPCTTCPKRSGNQKDLFSDVANPDVCTDPKCFDQKRQAHYAVARKAQEAKGKKVIHGDQAKKLLPHWENGGDWMEHGSPYRKLNDTVYSGYSSRRVGEVLGKDYNTVLIEHPLTGKFIEVAARQAIDEALKTKKGKGAAASGNSHTSWRPKPKPGPDVDDMLTDRLAELVHKKAPKQFGKTWLLALVKELRGQLNLRDEDAVAKAWGWPASSFRSGYRRTLPAQASKLGERDLVLLMFHLIFACGPYTRADVLKLFGIKEPEIRTQIIEQRKAAARKAREEKKAEKARKQQLKKATAKTAKAGKQLASFLRPVKPKPALAALVGAGPITRVDITKKLWGYIKRNGLQDKKQRRIINSDAKLKALFGGKKRVSMFEMTKFVGRQFTAA